MNHVRIGPDTPDLEAEYYLRNPVKPCIIRSGQNYPPYIIKAFNRRFYKTIFFFNFFNNSFASTVVFVDIVFLS